jgi:hypothetical protein
MYRTFLERPCPFVAAQAFSIVILLIQLDVFRRRRPAEIVDVDMLRHIAAFKSTR